MGQCMFRGWDPYVRQYDSESLASSISGYRTWKGHSESKGAKKRDKSVGNGNSKPSRGVATSFGFRRRPASSSRADDNARRKQREHDRNGNGGSSEDLRPEDMLSGRSTPLAAPRKEAAQGHRGNSRFGFRQPSSKAKVGVGDVNLAAEHAFSLQKDKETSINNNALGKKNTNTVHSNQLPLVATQVSSTGVTSIVGAAGVPKTVTKQTVILTYQTQQYSVHDGRAKSVGRDYTRGVSIPCHNNVPQRPPGKYTFQTNHLPKPQYPAVKLVDTKTAKQVVNNTRKAGVTESWREGAESAVSTDSGVCVGERDESCRRRPRNLEMVMRNAHSFHLRELQVSDLDIMDDAVVTGHTVIPLPKLPSSFDGKTSPDIFEPAPTYRAPSPVVLPVERLSPVNRSPMSTLDRYRTRTRPSRISNIYKDEEKFILDKAQPERLNKQNSFTKPSSEVTSPTTISSSKESSPSCKSEESHFTSGAWQNQAAGEAMANRSQDDVSVNLSVSSCEDDKSRLDADNLPKLSFEVPRKTIVIADEPSVPHPLLMKSLTYSHNESMMGSMISSNYSTTSTCTNQSGVHAPLTLTLEETKFDLSALETSTQSLLDDETSPADSLISSTSTTDSNNELVIERDVQSVSSSAYQTANTKTRSPEPELEEVDAEIHEKETHAQTTTAVGSNDVSPLSSGTPTHASGSLSLSDGRDYFDDEIADQPALLFRKNSESSRTLENDTNKLLRRSKERVGQSPLMQRSRKSNGTRVGTERTPSLDTLSSLASDDLMMDNDLAKSVTSLQSVDDYIERLDSSFRSGLNNLDEKQLQKQLISSKTAVRQWSQLLEQSDLLDRQLAAISGQQSLADSTTSLTSLGASLPVRTARLLQRSRATTPSDALSDGSVSPAPANLLQDVVDIKTLLLQLKRVLQEPGELHSMSSETLDPLAARCNNGRKLLAPAPLHPDATGEMRRQILYLQSQLEERDRVVRVLQQQMLRMAEGHEVRSNSEDTCNVATQTDRLRPPMTTPLTSSESSGLVSWNEQGSARKLTTYSEAQRPKSKVNNMKCTCGARINGQQTNADVPDTVTTNSRIGSKYLQAVANHSERLYIKRDSSLDANRNLRKYNLYSSRSKSIENFQNHCLKNERFDTKTVIEEAPLMKHQSYSDLYNGRISSKESVNRHSPSLNGQSTDTDYSSDGGYKSLPSSINYKGAYPKKISGIPRRSVETRLISTKSVKASAV